MPESMIVVSAGRSDGKWLQPKGKQNLISWCAEALLKDGIQLVFNPESPSTPGEAEISAMIADIGRADVMVLLLSKAYLASPFIRERILPEIESRHRTGGLRIVAIRLEALEWPEAGLEWLQALPVVPGDHRTIDDVVRDSSKMPRLRSEVLRAIRNTVRAGDPGAAPITRHRLVTSSTIKTAPQRTFGPKHGIRHNRGAVQSAGASAEEQPTAPGEDRPLAPAPTATAPAASPPRVTPATAARPTPALPRRSPAGQLYTPPTRSSRSAPPSEDDTHDDSSPASRGPRTATRMLPLIGKAVAAVAAVTGLLWGAQALWTRPWPAGARQVAAAETLREWEPLAVGNSWTYKWSQPEAVAGQRIVRGGTWYTLGGRSLFTRRLTQIADAHVETYSITNVQEGRFQVALSTSPATLARDGRYEGHAGIELYWQSKAIGRRQAVALKECIIRPLDPIARQGGLEAAMTETNAPLPRDTRNQLYVEIRRNGRYDWGTSSEADSRVSMTIGLADKAVATPAGQFTNCLHAASTIFDVQPSGATALWTTHAFFAPGIGLVREYQEAADGTVTYQRDLIGYRLSDGREVAPPQPPPDAVPEVETETPLPESPATTAGVSEAPTEASVESPVAVGGFEWLTEELGPEPQPATEKPVNATPPPPDRTDVEDDPLQTGDFSILDETAPAKPQASDTVTTPAGELPASPEAAPAPKEKKIEIITIF